MMKTFKLIIEWVMGWVVVFLSRFNFFNNHSLYCLPKFERSYVETDEGLICIYTTSHKGFLNVWKIEKVNGDRAINS